MTQDDVVTLLRELSASGARELQLKVPARPLLREGGRLLPTQHAAMTPEAMHRFATHLLTIARIEIPLGQVRHREFSFGVHKLGRFHATIYRQRGTLAISIAKLALPIPTLEDLGLDTSIESVFDQNGLVLICGTRERAAAMACLIDRYNAAHRGLVIVVEDPMTYLHRDGTAIIAQRDVGTDVDNMAAGVCGAVRQGADVIAAGHVKDRATAESVLRAAEEECLVLACVSAPDASLAASWLLRHYDSDRDMDVKARVKRVLRGVLCVPEEGAARYVTRRPSLRKAS